MNAMASQITILTIVYSTVYSVTNQRKYQSSASLAFVQGIHRWPVNSPHKGPLTRKMLPFDDVIMFAIQDGNDVVNDTFKSISPIAKHLTSSKPFAGNVGELLNDVIWHGNTSCHDDVIKRKHFSRYWLFVRGIHRSPVNSPYKGQWRGALIFSMICAWINGWVNNREAGDLRRHRAHYDDIVMWCFLWCQPGETKVECRWFAMTWRSRDVITMLQLNDSDHSAFSNSKFTVILCSWNIPHIHWDVTHI